MNSFVGFSSLKRDLSRDIHIIKNMNMKLQKRVIDEKEYFVNKNINLGHTNLIISEDENKKQPMSIKYEDAIYTIVYNGQIYNKDEIRKELKQLGYEFERIFRHRSFSKSVYSLWHRYIKQIKWDI